MPALFSGLISFAALGIVLCSLYYFLDPTLQKGIIFRGRSEYGLNSVQEVDGQRVFINGRVIHGAQPLDEGELKPSMYYVDGSGVSVAFKAMRQFKNGPIRVGVLGLGAGAMSTWLEDGDSVRFYEINPMVFDIAKKYFSFLEKAPGTKEVIIGDGRIRLKQELDDAGSHEFDLLFMDAFSSDSVPVHLLTEECVQIYLEHLSKDGVLVFHISNHSSICCQSFCITPKGST